LLPSSFFVFHIFHSLSHFFLFHLIGTKIGKH
jgi:hypothetical protein